MKYEKLVQHRNGEWALDRPIGFFSLYQDKKRMKRSFNGMRDR